MHSILESAQLTKLKLPYKQMKVYLCRVMSTQLSKWQIAMLLGIDMPKLQRPAATQMILKCIRTQIWRVEPL